jgi:hypothetical protein
MGEGMRGLASEITEPCFFVLRRRGRDTLTKGFNFLWKGGASHERETG